MKRIVWAIGVAVVGLVRGTSALGAQAPAAAPTHQWFPAPPIVPPGAQIAVVSGNPAQPGRFTAELSMPDGYLWAPHSHMADELMEVKAGTFLFGTGDKVDRRTVRPMAAGDTVTMAAGMSHYGIAKGATIVAVTIVGPYVINYASGYVYPPRSRAYPF